MAECGAFVCFSLCSFLISLLIFQFSFAEETTAIIDDCKRSCERSYPLHTYPKEEPLKACKQGCRLSSIEQHANRVNGTKSCITGCQESYVDPESVYACYMGCELQHHVIPFPASAMEGIMQDQWSMKSYMLYVYPVLEVSKYCTGFMSRASHYYQMSVGYYYSSDGDGVVVQVNEMPQAFVGVSSVNGDASDSDEPQNYDVAYTGLNDDDSSYSYRVVSKGQRWLQCVSQRTGLPMWFLMSTLLLSLFFLMWLCCATASTAPNEKRRKPAVVSELLYLDENSLLEKLPLVQVEEKDEASPLPVKVHIDSTTI